MSEIKESFKNIPVVYRVHAGYIFLLLMLAIIGLITSKWGDNPKLVEYVTFAVTVSSLLLAILAIAYTVYSNTSFGRNIQTLDTASKDISSVSQTVAAATIELQNRIDGLPKILASVESKVDALLIRNASASAEESRAPSEDEKEAISELGELFVDRLSLAGLLVIYTIFLHFKEKKIFVAEAIFKKLQGVETPWAFGVFVTFYAAGFADWDDIDSDNKKFTILRFDDSLAEMLDGKILKVIEEVVIDNEDRASQIKLCIDNIEIITAEVNDAPAIES